MTDLLEQLSNSDLRAIANARASRKFLSRKTLGYIVVTGAAVITVGVLAGMMSLFLVWGILWAGVYVFITSRVGDRIYRRLLELRTQEEMEV